MLVAQKNSSYELLSSTTLVVLLVAIQIHSVMFVGLDFYYLTYILEALPSETVVLPCNNMSIVSHLCQLHISQKFFYDL